MESPKSMIDRFTSEPKISDDRTRCKNDTDCKHPGRLNEAEPFPKPSEDVPNEPHPEVARTPIARADVNRWQL